MMQENEENPDVEVPEEEAPKKTRASRKKAKQVQIFSSVNIQRQKTPTGSAPFATFKAPMPPDPGDTIEIKTERGHHYSGVCEEVEDVDGMTVVSFTKEGLKPA